MARDAVTIPAVDVIIPTYNNADYLYPCLNSLQATRSVYPVRLLVVNNGHRDSVEADVDSGIEVIQADRNLGWEGGLALGLQHSTAPFVVFSNDDIYMPPASVHWARMLMTVMKDARVAAAGPTSNVVMGIQNIWAATSFHTYDVPFLIGFFVMIRRSALDAVGGIDTTLPGGDDIDLAIRFRQAGYVLRNRRDLFVYHHGFKTGQRLHGTYWNSLDMTERTDMALIRKHGIKIWSETLETYLCQSTSNMDSTEDWEGNAVRQWVQGARILELGCGATLTVPGAIGVDLIGEGFETYRHEVSQAAVVADVFTALPFESESADTLIARHILEHAINPFEVLQAWRAVLKPGGRLIIAAPNEDLCAGMPMDLTHKHAWNPDGMRALGEACGFRHVAYSPNCGNGFSFVMVLERA